MGQWCESVSLEQYEFYNVIPHVVASSSLDDVDVELLLQKVHAKRKVVALGGFASRVLNKYAISHMQIDHPSPRNRNLNDPAYELKMLDRLRDYLNV